MVSNNKKGQAALEFLTTYGWAFLVILVMIAALAYFGVLSPSKFLPEKCQFPVGTSCQNYKLTDAASDEVQFTLQNAFPNTLYIQNVQVRSATATDFVDCTEANAGDIPDTIAPDGTGEFLCTIRLADGTETVVGTEKQKVFVKITYSTVSAGDTDYVKTLEGEIYAAGMTPTT